MWQASSPPSVHWISRNDAARCCIRWLESVLKEKRLTGASVQNDRQKNIHIEGENCNE